MSKVVRLDTHFSLGTDPNAQVRDFFSYTGSLSIPDAQTWLTAARTAWNADVQVYLSTNCATTLFEMTDLSSASAPQVQDTTGAAGTDSTGDLPAGTAMLMHKHILRRYRGGKPRLYLPGLSINRLATADTWSSGALTSIGGAYAEYIAAVIAACPAAAGTALHVNVSYFEGFTNHTYPSGRVKPIPNPRPVPLVDVIVSTSPLAQVASQRRRNQTV